MHHPIISGTLLGLAVALAIVCSLGLLVMQDAHQRNQYSAPVVTLSMLFITIAVFLEESDSQARFKVVLIFVLLLTMNSILSHATGRAIRIRQMGHWEPDEKEQIPIVEDKGIAGAAPFAGDKS